MALQEVKCDCCGIVMVRDDWDGQYYLEDQHGLWNKIVPYIEEDDVLVCTEECYFDDKEFQKARLDYFKERCLDDRGDYLYQAQKEGEL